MPQHAHVLLRKDALGLAAEAVLSGEAEFAVAAVPGSLAASNNFLERSKVII